MSAKIIITVVLIMLIVGTLFALVWWWLADIVFPGASERTGQRIMPGRDRQAPPPDATVIRDFDQQPPAPPAV